MVEDLLAELHHLAALSLPMLCFIANVPIVGRGGMFHHPLDDRMPGGDAKSDALFQSDLVSARHILEMLDSVLGFGITLTFANGAGFRYELLEFSGL